MCATIRKQDSRLDFGVLRYPVTLQQIARFERANDLRVGVYGWDCKKDQIELLRRPCSGDGTFVGVSPGPGGRCTLGQTLTGGDPEWPVL